MDLIERSYHAASVALHEAGHLVCAQLAGGTLHGATLNMESFAGQAFYRMPNSKSIDDAASVAAGAVSQAKYLGHRRWQDCLSGGDVEELAQCAESMGAGDLDEFISRAGRRAKQILSAPGAWTKVQRLAVRLLESNGNLNLG